MMVKNDLREYKELSHLSILDYYTYIEVVNRNMAKMAKNGKGKDNIQGR